MKDILGPNQSELSCLFYHTSHQVVCNDHVYHPDEKLTGASSIFWVYLSAYIGLIIICGVMQGLVLVVASLDLTMLRVMSQAGTEKAKKYAKRLMPIGKKHHLIMVSLIVANSLAAEGMPVVLDRLTNPIVAVLVSATAFLIFGEIIPQAVCSRYSLPIGYHMSFVLWGLTGLFYIISYPASLFLDWLLGKDHGTLYKRKELSALVDIHGPELVKAENGSQAITCGPKHKVESCSTERLSSDEVLVIKGALSMAQKVARHVMVKWEDVYMLPEDAILDESLINEIFTVGHSRIPVYEKNRRNVIGVFLTKRLILNNPKEPRSIAELFSGPDAVQSWYEPYLVDEKMPLYDLLNVFQTGTASHMAFVTKTTETTAVEVIGIVTLEDLIEELLQEEIRDESDLQRQWRLQVAKVKMVQRLTRGKDSIAGLDKNPQFVRHLSAPSVLSFDLPTSERKSSTSSCTSNIA